MTAFGLPPERPWRSCRTDPLPSDEEALDQPLRAFPSWFLRIECDRCGAMWMISERHSPPGALTIRQIITQMRHDGCGGQPGSVGLVTGIEGVLSQPVRRIVMREF